MFMIANSFHTSLMEVEAIVNLSWEDRTVTPAKRRFTNLKLDVTKISMFCYQLGRRTYHRRRSPLYELSQSDCKNGVQIFILIRHLTTRLVKPCIHAKLSLDRYGLGC